METLVQMERLSEYWLKFGRRRYRDRTCKYEMGGLDVSNVVLAKVYKMIKNIPVYLPMPNPFRPNVIGWLTAHPVNNYGDLGLGRVRHYTTLVSRLHETYSTLGTSSDQFIHEIKPQWATCGWPFPSASRMLGSNGAPHVASSHKHE